MSSVQSASVLAVVQRFSGPNDELPARGIKFVMGTTMIGGEQSPTFQRD